MRISSRPGSTRPLSGLIAAVSLSDGYVPYQAGWIERTSIISGRIE